MNFGKPQKLHWRRAGMLLAAVLVAATIASAAADHDRTVFVVTSTNNATGNAVVSFKLETGGTRSLSLQDTLPTGGNGGASTNGGILQFNNERGAVANWGSNTVTELVRNGDSIGIGKTIDLAPNCVKPDSVALTKDHLFVVGTTCAESHAWPSGGVDGRIVRLPDSSAAQIAVGDTWAAVTLASGSVLQLPLTGEDGVLTGISNTITLPANANNTPLGAAFWGNILGFTPAHSPDSFAILDANRNLFPIAGPTPSFPTNAPCWVAKGPLSVWYTGNTPNNSISIFLTDAQGGVFYKSVALPGSPTDVAVSRDQKWLAVIYAASGEAHVAVFAIDGFGDLKPVANSDSIGVTSFNGVAFSE